MAMAVLVDPADATPNPIVVFATFFLFVLIFVYDMMVSIRRLHDLNRPGSHALLLFLPFYNIYLQLVLLFKKGTDGPNPYGPDPIEEMTIGEKWGSKQYALLTLFLIAILATLIMLLVNPGQS